MQSQHLNGNNDMILMSRRQLIADRLFRAGTLLIFAVGTVLFIYFMSEITQVGRTLENLIQSHETDREAATARSGIVVRNAVDAIACHMRNQALPLDEATTVCSRILERKP